MMNPTRLASITLLASMVIAGASAEPVTPLQDEDDPIHVFLSDDGGDTQGQYLFESRALEVRVENGEVTVKLNGEEVPPERLKREGGRIMILDDNGDLVDSVRIGVGAGDDNSLLFFNALGDAEFEFHPQAQVRGFRVERPRALMGVHLDEPGPALRKHLRLGDRHGTLITGVWQGLPADKAGIGLYDVIIEVEGEGPADPDMIRERIADLEPGTAVKLRVIQEGRQKSVVVELIGSEEAEYDDAKFIGSARTGPLGGSGFFLQAPQGGIVLPEGIGHNLRDIVISPDREIYEVWRDRDNNIEKGMDEVRRRLNQGSGQAAPAQPQASTDLDERIDRLSQRIADLERMLDRLIERLE